MSVMTPSFLSDLVTNLTVIGEDSYTERNKDLWWQRVAAVKTSQSKREVLVWLANSAKLRVRDAEGQVEFENLITNMHEYTHKPSSTGIELFEGDFEDLDGGGLQLATEWVRKMSAEFAYAPQERLADAIKANPTAFDGRPFFDAAHPVSGIAGDTSMGTYSNLITGKPIDDSVTIDVAKKNLGAAIAAARAIKAPDGRPRSLRPVGLLVPGTLATRAVDLLAARFIGSAGSTDHVQTINAWNLGMPIIADELNAAFGGSDTTYYLVMSDSTASDLGAFVWSIRKDFRIKYPSMQDALYQAHNLLRWVADGRHAIVPGLPFKLVRVTG